MGWLYSRIQPESTQEVNQIQDLFWFFSTAVSPQDFKKGVNKPELIQKVPRNSIKPGLCLVCLLFFQILGPFCCVNKSERTQNSIEFLGTIILLMQPEGLLIWPLAINSIIFKFCLQKNQRFAWRENQYPLTMGDIVPSNLGLTLQGFFEPRPFWNYKGARKQCS